MYGYYPDTTHFVVHMMDMDSFYAGSSKLNYVKDQIPRLAAMARQSQGRLLPFVAFDPTRSDAVAVVSNAVQTHGFRGVKFYPPSGYRPLHNTEDDVPPGTDPAHVEAMIRNLYDYCTGEGIPIFTHCQPEGMDARPGSGGLSHPYGWRDVLREYPGLRLCIGHAGGEPAWFKAGLSDEDAEWRRETVRLCCEYEHVYCEVGHLDDLTDVAARQRFGSRLAEARETKGPYSFPDKVMYGSDYHLITRIHRFQRIPALLEEAFEGAGYDVESFFRGAARRYLGLLQT